MTLFPSLNRALTLSRYQIRVRQAVELPGLLSPGLPCTLMS